MKNFTYILLFVFAFSFISCRKEEAKSSNGIIVSKNHISDNSKVVDTTIFLSKIKISKDNCSHIAGEEAEKFLYKYFKRQGALPRNEIKDYSKENLCIDYDTIYNLKSNKTCSAIIRYWLQPADLNGTCVQPSMAIISKVHGSLSITNEEFVNSDFIIDSIADNLIVYGHKFDCSEHKVLKNYRLRLEIK